MRDASIQVRPTRTEEANAPLRRLALPNGAAFGVVAVAAFLAFASNSAASPLYRVYQIQFGFSAITLTLLFTVYVIVLLGTLLSLGSLSDYVGRRPLLLAGLATGAVACGLFLLANGVGLLFAARALQDLAVGLITGAAAAALHDLRPHGSAAPLLSSAAPTGGQALGAIAASALAQYAPAPTRPTWWLLLGVFVASLLAVLTVQEPGTRRPYPLASLRPRVSVPRPARGAFATALPCLVGLWALGGFYLSLGPSLAAELLHSRNLLWGGILIFMLSGLGVAASGALAKVRPARVMLAGCLAVTAGALVTFAAIETSTPWVLFLGTAMAGLGSGPAFLGAYRSTATTSMVTPGQRAGLITAIYIVGYVATAVEARLFGPVEVAAGGRRLGPRDLGGPKAKQVLELLLMARGHSVTKDRLADRLWGEAVPKRAFAALENHVSVLRRHLDGVGRGRDLVVTDPGGYRLAAEQIDLDLDRFDERITAAGKAGTRMARELLSEAVRAGARGEVLEDEPYAQWAEELRRTYRARLLGVHLDAAESALAERDARSAIDHAQAAMAIDPYAERAHRLAMLAHYTQGDQRESLAGYQRLRSLLSADLGVEPTPQTRQVQAAILAQEAPASLLPRPLERQGPPPRPNNAPLIGRRAELRRLEALAGEACDSTLAIVVVEGEDGVGKTRLLDELAARLPGVGVGRGDCTELERHLPYVPLASALREALGAPAIADAGLPALAAVFPELGPGPAGSPPPETAALESLVGLWRSHAPLVLLLDDLHWADPATMAALAYLHRRSAVLPGAVIATAGAEQALTSHQLHRLPASARITLPPLSHEELAEAGLEHLHAPTRGHPRLLAATLAAGDRAQVLASLADVLLARCRAEGPQAYSLLVCASALDQPFDPAVLARVAGRSLDEALGRLESLREHRVLEAAGLGYRFRHQMVGEALRQSLSPALRRFITQRAELARTAPGQQGAPSTAGFDAVDHPIYVIDPARDRIVEANRACEWLGYSTLPMARAPRRHAHHRTATTPGCERERAYGCGNRVAGAQPPETSLACPVVQVTPPGERGRHGVPSGARSS